MPIDQCRVISFVSYKGGSGRSVSLANIAFHLAKTFRVGCVDFDIEAGGLHKVFDIGDPFGKDSLQHFLMDEADLGEFLQTDNIPDYIGSASDFADRLVIDVLNDTTSPLGGFEVSGKLFLVQARPNAELTGRVDTGMNMFFRFHKLLEMFTISCHLDFLFIDCRSGISKLGLPGLAYSDLVTLFLRWGTQHRYGTEAFLHWFHGWLAEAGMKKQVLLVPSSIDTSVVTNDQIQLFVQENLSNIPTGFSTIPRLPLLDHNDVVLTAGDHGQDITAPYEKVANDILAAVEDAGNG